MFWPLPSQFRFASPTPAIDGLAVEVQLLDGQLIRGDLPADGNLLASSELKLLFRGRPLVIAVSEIRNVTCSDCLVQTTDSGTPALPGEGLTHEEPGIFHVLFADGKLLEGLTWGYLNRKIGGVYLYVQQADSRFKAVWIPRNSLQSIHFDPSHRTVLAPGLSAQRVQPEEIVAVKTAPPNAGLARTMDELSLRMDEARGKPMISLAQALLELKLLDQKTFLELQAGESGKFRAYIDDRVANSADFQLELEHTRAHMVRTPEVDAEAFQVAAEALTKISWEDAAKHSVVPLGVISGTLYLASSAPMSRELLGRLSMVAGGGNLMLVWASKRQIDARIGREVDSDPAQEGAASGPVLKAGLPVHQVQDLSSLLAAAQHEIRVQGAEVHSTAVDERSSVVLLVKRVITDAHKQKASDIHIETNPGGESSRIRFRIDGDLEEYLKLPAELRAALVSRIKVMSKLDISERRRPQDGKINFSDYSGIKLELRVAILPTHDNFEDVVMRLLASSKPIALAQLGFSVRDSEIVKRLALHPYGLLLACGPTGSGKTTTLHSLLSEINTENRKIWTAEDPIEITQPGLRQLQVNPKIGLTFAAAMRAFLRADPDVIMIGEVRDEETARVCIEASLTGHLVLSTLHTNGAAESVSRLLDLGMDPMNFGDSLIGIVAQRLVRGLCQHCATSKVLSDDEFGSLAHEYVVGTELTMEEGHKRLLAAASSGNQVKAPASMRLAVGCEHCGGRGYKGRTGIYEVLENVGDMKHKIQIGAPTSDIFAEASRAGMRTLRQDALEKVLAGVIDLKQAQTVYT